MSTVALLWPVKIFHRCYVLPFIVCLVGGYFSFTRRTHPEFWPGPPGVPADTTVKWCTHTFGNSHPLSRQESFSALSPLPIAHSTAARVLVSCISCPCEGFSSKCHRRTPTPIGVSNFRILMPQGKYIWLGFSSQLF
jgi:hypothetical protein